jgi:hypothetical protein
MNHQARGTGNLERRIRHAERNLFAAVGADVEESFIELARTGLRDPTTRTCPSSAHGRRSARSEAPRSTRCPAGTPPGSSTPGTRPG